MSWLFKSNCPYIEPKEHSRIRKHKYEGEELSITYNYFYSPICAVVVEYFPLWLSANIVSFIGFLCNFGTHILFIVACGSSFHGPVAPWVCYTTLVLYFIYHICDNADGKQARRTKSSSPLGMLFDHGIDCFTSMMIPMVFMRMMQIGDSFFSVLGVFVAILAFYYATMEFYYTGLLIMQKVNGVDDGSIMLFAICIANAIWGVDMWNAEFDFWGNPDYRFRVIEYFSVFACVFSLNATAENLMNIYKKSNSLHFKKIFERGHFLALNSFFFLNTAIFFVPMYLSPSAIMRSKPRIALYPYAFNYILVTLRM